MIDNESQLKQIGFLDEFYAPIMKDLALQQGDISPQRNSDESSFEPEYNQIKRLGFKVNKKKFKRGSWHFQENYLYLKFMLENFHDFNSEYNRRRLKVFLRLSKILKKRTPDQCRSHHQKLQIKFNDDLPSILRELNRKIQTQIASEHLNARSLTENKDFQRIIQRAALNPKNEPLKIVAKESWYQIEKNSIHIKITINESSIKTWQS